MANLKTPGVCCEIDVPGDSCTSGDDLNLQQTPITSEQFYRYAVGDVFLGSARRLLEPLVLFDVEHTGFLGLNEELDSSFRHGYDVYFYDLRHESHSDFWNEGNHGGSALPTKRANRLPPGIEVSDESSNLMRWLLTEGALILQDGYNPLKQLAGKCALAAASYEIIEHGIQHFEWLKAELLTGQLKIDERYSKPFVVTRIEVTAEDRFTKYLLTNPDDNVARQHPPTAEKYL